MCREAQRTGWRRIARRRSGTARRAACARGRALRVVGTAGKQRVGDLRTPDLDAFNLASRELLDAL